jgi:hypothetical protein
MKPAATMCAGAAVFSMLTASSCGGEIARSSSDADAEAGLEMAPDGTSSGQRLSDGAADVLSGDRPDGSDDREAEAGGTCFIDTSRYDQSCSLDSDCVAEVEDAGVGLRGLIVQSGDYCQAMCFCPGMAISRVAVAQYVADVARTPLGSGAISPQFCDCGVTYAPCCLDGHCFGACYTPELFPKGSNAEADGDVPCGRQTGPLDAGNLGTQPFLVCRPPETCQRISGGWGCCSSGATGSTCYKPGAVDGG